MSRKKKRQARRGTTSQTKSSQRTSARSYQDDFDPDYSYVIKDLRRIGTLAGTFLLILIILAFFLRWFDWLNNYNFYHPQDQDSVTLELKYYLLSDCSFRRGWIIIKWGYEQFTSTLVFSNKNCSQHPFAGFLFVFGLSVSGDHSTTNSRDYSCLCFISTSKPNPESLEGSSSFGYRSQLHNTDPVCCNIIVTPDTAPCWSIWQFKLGFATTAPAAAGLTAVRWPSSQNIDKSWPLSWLNSSMRPAFAGRLIL